MYACVHVCMCCFWNHLIWLVCVIYFQKDNSPNIQFEAFHVFKVFVANPQKPSEIVSILFKNKDKLIAYLENFHSDKDDAQFAEEKQLIIQTLAELEAPAVRIIYYLLFTTCCYV